MERDFFITTYPQAKMKIEVSLGVSLLTNLQLVDYFLFNSSSQPDSIKEMSDKLPNKVKEDLRILRTVFAHGVILRDYYINHTEKLNQDWKCFIQFWEQFNEEDVLDLVIYGIRENMNYYYQYLPTNEAVEEAMKEVSLDYEHLKDPSNRERALRALLISWYVENIDEILPIFNDLSEVKRLIKRLIKGFWEAGFKDVSKNVYLSDWRLKIAPKLNQTYGTNIDAIFNITSLYPDMKEMERINRAEWITFIPVPSMGRLITFYEKENHVYLMFDPFVKNENIKKTTLNINENFPLFEGLGDLTRLQIIDLLAKNNEMYAQQIVEALQMKQSTISRHLNQLHQANLLRVRQEGNTKYFSINKDEIKKVIVVLESFLR